MSEGVAGKRGLGYEDDETTGDADGPTLFFECEHTCTARARAHWRTRRSHRHRQQPAHALLPISHPAQCARAGRATHARPARFPTSPMPPSPISPVPKFHAADPIAHHTDTKDLSLRGTPRPACGLGAALLVRARLR